jgi:hypothetical protein
MRGLCPAAVYQNRQARENVDFWITPASSIADGTAISQLKGLFTCRS